MSSHALPIPAELADAEHVAELITSSWISHAIGAAIELGIFDALAEAPAGHESLAASLECSPSGLLQLLRACESLGLCRLDGEAQWQLTGTGRLLASAADGSQHAWARLWCRELAGLWSGLAGAVRRGTSVRKIRGEADGFMPLQVDPGRADTFHRAMTSDSWWVADAFARLPALETCRHVVDVGGGHGVLIVALLRQHPECRGTVFDMAHAESGATSAFQAAGVADRADFVAGDFFAQVPAGADTYVLKSVLHDWPDDRCAAILARCRSAMSTSARLFVLERVTALPLGAATGDRAWARSDLNMLVAHGACERTRDGYAALLGRAGFALAAVYPLAMGVSAIEAIPTDVNPRAATPGADRRDPIE